MVGKVARFLTLSVCADDSGASVDRAVVAVEVVGFDARTVTPLTDAVRATTRLWRTELWLHDDNSLTALAIRIVFAAAPPLLCSAIALTDLTANDWEVAVDLYSGAATWRPQHTKGDGQHPEETAEPHPPAIPAPAGAIRAVLRDFLPPSGLASIAGAP